MKLTIRKWIYDQNCYRTWEEIYNSTDIPTRDIILRFLISYNNEKVEIVDWTNWNLIDET